MDLCAGDVLSTSVMPRPRAESADGDAVEINDARRDAAASDEDAVGARITLTPSRRYVCVCERENENEPNAGGGEAIFVVQLRKLHVVRSRLIRDRSFLLHKHIHTQTMSKRDTHKKGRYRARYSAIYVCMTHVDREETAPPQPSLWKEKNKRKRNRLMKEKKTWA